MASIRKLKNGKYEATVYVGRAGDGKQIRKYIHKDSLKACKSAAREMEQEISEKMYVDVPNYRFDKWGDLWLELNKGRLSPTTHMNYTGYAKNHFNPFFSDMRLSRITRIHIQEFMNDKLETLSVGYVRKLMFVLREILDDALQHKNPCRNIELPAPIKRQADILTSEDLEKLRVMTNNSKYEIIILLSAWCGLRRGEIFALEWNDIDWNEDTIRIDESLAITPNGYVAKCPKSANGTRGVTAPKLLLEMLLAYRASMKNISLRIFDTRPDTCSQTFRGIANRAGLPKIRFHDLRHYHASWLYTEGIPDHYAAERLGHDINVLKGIYQHLGLKQKTIIDQQIKAIK